MRRVHFIGICGTAMATLAALLKARGHHVQGSDAHVYPPMSDFLAREGITVFDGYVARAPRSPASTWSSSATPSRAATRNWRRCSTVRWRYASLPETIRDEFLWDAEAVVVAGTHGKTTTTALAAWLLTSGGLDPSMLVGGIARNFGDGGASYRLGAGRTFVIEGDEYDSAYFDKTAKFLKYLPDIAVVNNVEFDHADIYADLDAVRLAFARLVRLVPRRGLVLLGADSPDAAVLARHAQCRVQTFGAERGCRLAGPRPAGRRRHDHVRAARTGRRERRDDRAAARRAQRAQRAGGRRPWRTPAGSTRRPSPGAWPVSPACSAGSKWSAAAAASPSTTTSRIIRPRSPRRWRRCAPPGPGARLWAIFEPRSASSCRRVFQDAFADAFGAADQVVIAPVFRSSLPDERAAVGQRARRRPGGARRGGATAPGRSTRSSRSSPPRRPAATRSWSCPTAASTASTGSCSRPQLRGAGAHAAIGPAPQAAAASGDSLLLVELEPRMDPAINARAVAHGADPAARPGCRGCATSSPSYACVGVHVDPLRLDVAALERAVARAWDAGSRSRQATGRLVEIPVTLRRRARPRSRRRGGVCRMYAPTRSSAATATRSTASTCSASCPASPTSARSTSVIAMPRRAGAARRRCRRQRRHRRPADRRLSRREPGRLAARRPDAVADVRRRRGTAPSLLDAGDRVRFVPVAAGQWPLLGEGPAA